MSLTSGANKCAVIVAQKHFNVNETFGRFTIMASSYNLVQSTIGS